MLRTALDWILSYFVLPIRLKRVSSLNSMNCTEKEEKKKCRQKLTTTAELSDYIKTFPHESTSSVPDVKAPRAVTSQSNRIRCANSRLSAELWAVMNNWVKVESISTPVTFSSSLYHPSPFSLWLCLEGVRVAVTVSIACPVPPTCACGLNK